MRFDARLVLAAVVAVLWCSPAFAGGCSDLNFSSGSGHESSLSNEVRWIIFSFYFVSPVVVGAVLGAAGALRKRWVRGPSRSFWLAALAGGVLGLSWFGIYQLRDPSPDGVHRALILLIVGGCQAVAPFGGWVIGLLAGAVIGAVCQRATKDRS